MASELREELNCSVCLNIYTDPITLSCGHTYCQVCIESVLDTQEGSGVYTCPDCRNQFNSRPELHRNLTLRNIMKLLLPNQPEPEESGIFCTYCIHRPVPTAKSCLHCEASLCDNHVRVHSTAEEHVLTAPTTSWGNRKCPLHRKLLEYYCPGNAACVCVSCTLAGEHRGHQVELLNEASDKKKEKLRNVLKNLTSKRENTEKRVQRLQEHRRQVQETAAGVTERLTALVRDMKRQLDVLEKRVLGDITRQQEQDLLQVSDLIQQLEREKDELSRKMCHIEELCNMADPLTVLQEPHNADSCDAERGHNEDTQREERELLAGGGLDEDLISVTLYRGLADIVTDVKVKSGFNVPEAPDMLLDINTAGNYVTVSGDFKTASRTEINQKRPKTPERFERNQVLSTRSFSSGRHYWEVETSESDYWSVGMCYPSIARRGEQSLIGDNNKSWCLGCINTDIFTFFCKNNDISVSHNSDITELSHKISCHRVGIFLDYKAGRLSFYELCDPIRHLHTFTATFTEPLHGVISVWDAWVRISS